jgi:trehalose synthase
MFVLHRRLADYENLVPDEILEELQQLGERLKGAKIVHINSTRVGGGVAEILMSLVPLSRDAGPETHWEVIEGPPEFFQVTKTFHNALQGEPAVVTPEMLELYQRVNERNAQKLKAVLESADVVIIHDYQPLALVEHRRRDAVWIWRCHIDVAHEAPPARLAGPQPSVWDLLQPYVEKFDAAVFSMATFAQGLAIPQYVVPPSIDPLSDKNCELPECDIERMYEKLGLPRDRKVFLQVSRFDRFKDPIGVIRAYQLFKQAYGIEGETCLVLAGGSAADDPEGAQVLEEVRARAEGQEDIFILDRPPTSHIEINALQRGADVVIQKSVREGFGLVVTEALWKRKPVVATPAGGITLQVLDGLTGFWARSDVELADRLQYLLEHPQVGVRLGEAGQHHVQQHFLTPRELRDYLRIVADLVSES